MPVQSRIKIIQVSNLEEVESKVNDFLAFDEHIAQLVHIDYRLESNFVIIEYYVMREDDDEDDNTKNNNNNNNKILLCSTKGDYSYNSTPLTYWWRFYYPFI